MDFLEFSFVNGRIRVVVYWKCSNSSRIEASGMLNLKVIESFNNWTS